MHLGPSSQKATSDPIASASPEREPYDITFGKAAGAACKNFMPRENSMAAPVSFIRWILIMASLGWAEACPKGLTDQGKPLLDVEFSGEGALRQPRCGLRAARPQGVHDAIL